MYACARARANTHKYPQTRKRIAKTLPIISRPAQADRQTDRQADRHSLPPRVHDRKLLTLVTFHFYILGSADSILSSAPPATNASLAVLPTTTSAFFRSLSCRRHSHWHDHYFARGSLNATGGSRRGGEAGAEIGPSNSWLRFHSQQFCLPPLPDEFPVSAQLYMPQAESHV